MNKKMWPSKVLFIGTYAGENHLKWLLENDLYVQTAANQTEKYYIEELSSYFDTVYVLSSIVTNGSKGSRLIMDQNEENNEHCQIINVGFVNLPYVSVCSQTNAMTKAVHKLQSSLLDSELLVIVYSMRIPYLKAAQEIKKINPDAVVINIVPDLPGYMRSGRISLIRKILDHYNRYKLERLGSVVNGYVLYSEYMKEKLNLQKKDWIVIEGIYNESPLDDNSESNTTPIVMYAGGLEEKYGIKVLIDGFVCANLPNVELHLYGFGSYISEIRKISAYNSNIKYCGILSPNDMKATMKKATALINPRPSNSEFTRYSCPSKVLEYMASGVPVIMTQLDGIPNEYYEYTYIIDSATSEGISKALKSFFADSYDNRMKKASLAQQFILENKTAKKQVERLMDFSRIIKSKL